MSLMGFPKGTFFCVRRECQYGFRVLAIAFVFLATDILLTQIEVSSRLALIMKK